MYYIFVFQLIITENMDWVQSELVPDFVREQIKE